MITKPNRTAIKGHTTDDGMRVGLFWPYHRTLIPSPVLAAMNPDPLDVTMHIRLAQQAEAAGIDSVLIADGYTSGTTDESREFGFKNPTTHAVLWAVPIFQATKTLGVITTMHTTFMHPVLIARMGAHLDWLSGGRWGWNVTTGFKEDDFLLFGFDEMLSHDERYARAEEAVAAVRAIWASQGSPIDFEGEYLRIRGQLNGPYPIQDSPVTVNAGSSDEGRSFAARTCDFSFVTLQRFADLKPLQERMETTTRPAGKPPTELIMGSTLVLREEPGRAQEEYDLWQATSDLAADAAYHDAIARGSRGYNLTDAAKPAKAVGPNDAPQFIGTVDEVTEKLLDARRAHGWKRVMFGLPSFGQGEVEMLGRVLRNLERAGEWVPPERRGYSW